MPLDILTNVLLSCMNQSMLSTAVNTGQLTLTGDPSSGNTTLSIDPIYDSMVNQKHQP